jgi:hypothetical protein
MQLINDKYIQSNFKPRIVYIAYKKNSITKLMLTFILDKIKAEGEYYSAQNFFDEQS